MPPIGNTRSSIYSFGYRKKYRPKPEIRNHRGSDLLKGMKVMGKGKKAPRGQLSLWGEWEADNLEILAVADKFVFANCYDLQVAGDILQK